MQITLHSTRTLLILTLLSLLLGCGPLVKRDEQTQRQRQLREQVAALLQAGELAQAASLLQTRAESSPSPEHESLLLRAGEIWELAGEWKRTKSLLQGLPFPLAEPQLAARQRLLLAELAIHDRDLERAQDLLQPPPGPDSPLMQRQRYHKAMAEIYRLSGNLLESARQLVELDALITDPETRQANQQLLVETLSVMTDTALTLLQPDPPGVLGGWMELVRILKHRSEDPKRFDAQISAWRETFPNHPARPDLLSLSTQAQPIDQHSTIAILLPGSGPYKKVATAVRDGFMAAWYQRPLANRPPLRFYDSSDPQQILQLFADAAAEGAQMVVGPLNKEAVSLLSQSGELQVPVLALNQVEQNQAPADNLFQFGLAPEDEAEQLAERAWLDGRTSALALTPGGDWGSRLYHSFRDRLEGLGGRVLEQQSYDAKANDFSAPIRRLLNIDESQARKQALQRVLGVPLEFEPRRRGDADMIFLAARPQKGRQLGPQLKFYHAGDLPIYATSHIYSSLGDSDRDKDLGRIRFVDTPWLLEADQQSPLSRANLERLIPGVKGRYARLYAMGIDAFELLPNLAQLQDHPGSIFNGKTGSLYLDGSRRIHRQLAWVDMQNGKARISGYAPRLEQPPQAATPAMGGMAASPAGRGGSPARVFPLPVKPPRSPD